MKTVRVVGLKLVALIVALGSQRAQAITYYWDSDANAGNGATDGAGTWNTTTANWYNGSTDVAWPNTTNDMAIIGAGNGAAGAVQIAATTTITLNGLTFNAAGSGNYSVTAANASTSLLSFDGINPTITVNADATISARLTGSANVTKVGSSTLTLSGSSAFWTGDLIVSNGIVQTGAANIRGLGAITVGTGKVIVDGTNTQAQIKHTNGFSQNASTEIDRDLVARNGGLIYSAGGNVNNRIGNVTLQGGTLTVDGTSTTYGGLFFGSVNGGADPVVTISGSALSTINGAGNLGLGSTNTIFDVADVTGDSSADLVVSAKVIKGTSITDVGNLVKRGAGTMLLTATNTYSGNTIVMGGLIAVSNNVALSTNQVTLAGGGLSAAPGNWAITNTINLVGSSTNDIAAGRSLTLAGAITNSGSLVKTGLGTLTLSGTNTFSGATSVLAGTLSLTQTNALPAEMDVYITSGATVELAEGTHIIRKLFIDGTSQPRMLLNSVNRPGVLSGTGSFYPMLGSKNGTLVSLF